MKTRDALLEPGNSIGYRGGDNQLVSTTWRRYTQAEIYCIFVFVYLYAYINYPVSRYNFVSFCNFVNIEMAFKYSESGNE